MRSAFSTAPIVSNHLVNLTENSGLRETLATASVCSSCLATSGVQVMNNILKTVGSSILKTSSSKPYALIQALISSLRLTEFAFNNLYFSARSIPANSLEEGLFTITINWSLFCGGTEWKRAVLCIFSSFCYSPNIAAMSSGNCKLYCCSKSAMLLCQWRNAAIISIPIYLAIVKLSLAPTHCFKCKQARPR